MFDDGWIGDAVVEADTTRAGVLGAGEAMGMDDCLAGDAIEVAVLSGVLLVGVDTLPWYSPGFLGALAMVLQG
jgi:hypothetical protein